MPYDSENKECGGDARGVLEDIVRNMRADESAALGFMCKRIIDINPKTALSSALMFLTMSSTHLLEN